MSDRNDPSGWSGLIQKTTEAAVAHLRAERSRRAGRETVDLASNDVKPIRLSRADAKDVGKYRAAKLRAEELGTRLVIEQC